MNQRNGVHIAESPTLFISAGEASGEHYGALLIHALRAQLATKGQTGRFFGMGGERMAAAGCDCIVRSEDVAVMGFTEVLLHLPRIYREFRRIKRALRERRPDVAVLIDFPGFHLKLAAAIHKLGIPVVYFVSPQLWAWKQHRIHQIHQSVDRMLVIFPFEQPFYRERGVLAEYVGHPLADLPQPTVSRSQLAVANGLDPDRTWLGLLPGSRIKEISANLPEMLAAAVQLDARSRERARLHSDEHDLAERVSTEHDSGRKDSERQDSTEQANAATPAHRQSGQLSFLLPLAPTLTPAQRQRTQQIIDLHAPGLDVHLIEDARAALFHARASIVASGTATIEAALIGNPFVVVYRVSPLTHAIAKRIVKVPHVAMVNLIANKRLIPELIQSEFTAARIVNELEPLLPDGPQRSTLMKELASLRALLKSPSTSASTSALIPALIPASTPASSAAQIPSAIPTQSDASPTAIERVAAETLRMIKWAEDQAGRKPDCSAQ